MNKAELVAAAAKKCNLNQKQVEEATNAILTCISEECFGGEEIRLVGFGTFKIREREAREGRNPHSGETQMFGASRTLVFHAANSNRMKDEAPKAKGKEKPKADKKADEAKAKKKK